MRNATRVIANNSFWYAFESVFGIFMVFATSIPMNRILGPERMDHFNYVTWISSVGTLIAIGIPAVTTKYMAEYLNRGEHSIARAIFDHTLFLQVLVATLITGSGELVVYLAGDPQYRAVSMMQVLAMLPGMVIAVPSQANNAYENMRANVAGSIVSSFVYLVGVVLSMFIFHWDLMGVATAFAVARTAEVLVRLPPVWRRVHAYPRGEIPVEVRPAMRTFALNSIGLMLINVVVWDKSDVFLLNFLSAGKGQISFFTVTFNIIEKLVLIPQVFGHALGITMMAEYGRDQSRVALIAKAAAKYMYLFAAPLLFGVALVSGPLMRVLYGDKYLPAIPVLAVAAGLALFKPLLLPVQYYLRTHNRQAPLLIWNSVCGVFNIGIDWTLIPRMGALGASIGNGVAQASAVVGIWIYAIVRYRLRLDFTALAKITIALLAMAPPILFLNSWLPPTVALIVHNAWIENLITLLVDATLGAGIYLGLLRWLRILDAEDCARLIHVGASVPNALRPTFQRLVDMMAPPVSQKV